MAEVNGHEQQRNLELVLAEFRNYQQGILPTGPGARSLTEFFASIDEKLDPAAAPAPRTQRSDRDVLNLLTKRAAVLHLGPANYCWFADPSRALCLKLAGTPAAADRPLVGMCDSARCPQATHHPRHRPVWAEHADKTKIFIGQLGTARKTERTRLQADFDRARRARAAVTVANAVPTADLLNGHTKSSAHGLCGHKPVTGHQDGQRRRVRTHHPRGPGPHLLADAGALLAHRR
ncbi:hypothetical protein [Streptomyces sp. NPDC002785]|uniref:hypothetical protein n=1 Tax=Streptomyces sp. NPDC002785 TaxID=3154543 RepID=UPI00332C3F64